MWLRTMHHCDKEKIEQDVICTCVKSGSSPIRVIEAIEKFDET